MTMKILLFVKTIWIYMFLVKFYSLTRQEVITEASSLDTRCGVTNLVFLKEDFIRKPTKTTLLTKYIHVCTSHHQLHMQTLYIIQNELI